jgi:quercetin dioxygenase-like cupin family protein
LIALMQTKPRIPESGEKDGRPMRDSSANSVVQARSTLTDIARAEDEGMGPPEPQASSATEERHDARQSELSARIMAFDLTAEVGDTSPHGEESQSGRTLAKLDTLRLTLMRLEAGKTIAEHQAAHQISIQTVRGHVVLHIDGLPFDLPAGNVVVLERHVAHDIVAKEDSTVLVTVAASA